MARYAATTSAPSGSDKGMLNVAANGTTRVGVYDVLVGCAVAPADTFVEIGINRSTDQGTGGQVLTEVELDPLGSAVTGVALGGAWSTTEPADTAGDFLTISMNQRATFRWVAAPGGELVSDVTANNGIFARSITATGTTSYEITFHWVE